jgi:tetratricopeptide (TPR) repeat protein
MKTIRFIILIAIAILSLGACNKEEFLGIHPKGTIIPSKIEDFRLMLDEVTNRFYYPSQGFSGKHKKSVFLSPDIFLNKKVVGLVSSFSKDLQNVYLFKDQLHTIGDSDNDWDTYYSQIYYANVVLYGLSTVSDGSTEQKEALKAEARLHRAYAYFNLVNSYGLHYNPATANTDLGVPIREGITLEGVKLPRASVQEVYDYLLKDITESIVTLQDTQPLNLSFRPSKVAAYGFLAKVYLYQGNYKESLKAVNNALNLYSSLRDINTDIVNADGIRQFPNNNQNVENVWYKMFNGAITVSDTFMDLYHMDDLRKEWFSKSIYGTVVDGVYKLEASPSLQLAGILTSDLYLMRAECNVRLGNTAMANTDLNTLRKNRFKTGSYTPLTLTDKDKLLAMVKEERRREILGLTEFAFDIKRYNLFDKDNISVTHTLEGETVTLKANSKNWALPIAPKITLLNPEIKQNPRD